MLKKNVAIILALLLSISPIFINAQITMAQTIDSDSSQNTSESNAASTESQGDSTSTDTSQTNSAGTSEASDTTQNHETNHDSSQNTSTTDVSNATSTESQATDTNASPNQEASQSESSNVDQHQEQGINRNVNQSQDIDSNQSGTVSQEAEVVGDSVQYQVIDASGATQTQNTNTDSTQVQVIATPNPASSSQTQGTDTLALQGQQVTTPTDGEAEQNQSNNITAGQGQTLNASSQLQGINVAANQQQDVETSSSGEVAQLQLAYITTDQSQHVDSDGTNQQTQTATLEQVENQQVITDGSLKANQTQNVNISGTIQSNPGAKQVAEAQIETSNSLEIARNATSAIAKIIQEIKVNGFHELVNWEYEIDESGTPQTKGLEKTYEFSWGKVNVGTSVTTEGSKTESGLLDKITANMTSFMSVIFKQQDPSDEHDEGNHDPDQDGLTNAEEKNLTTNPANPDSDGDGLKDGHEVKVSKTNPLKKDSDGDGIPDGEEAFNEVIHQNLKAIREGDATGYMSTLSSKSKNYNETKQFIEEFFKVYKLKAKAQHMELMEVKGDTVKVKVNHTIRKQEGPDFVNQNTETMYTLVLDEDSFKILDAKVLKMSAIE